MIWVVVLSTIRFIVAGQAVWYTIVCTIYMLDGKIELGYVFPPPCLVTGQVSLKVLETLVIGNYDKFSS